MKSLVGKEFYWVQHNDMEIKYAKIQHICIVDEKFSFTGVGTDIKGILHSQDLNYLCETFEEAELVLYLKKRSLCMDRINNLNSEINNVNYVIEELQEENSHLKELFPEEFI